MTEQISSMIAIVVALAEPRAELSTVELRLVLKDYLFPPLSLTGLRIHEEGLS